MNRFPTGGGIVSQPPRRAGCPAALWHNFWPDFGSQKNSRGGMALFSGYRADRLIAEVRESGDPASAKAKQALAKLQSLGATAIKPIVDALATADERETVAFVETLTPLIDNKTFPVLAHALAEENPRAVQG